VTRRSGNTDGLIASRVPDMNGTQTTRTRSAGSGILLKVLLCTQLASARHVIQVGEKSSNSRGWPAERLNSDFNVEIVVSEITLALGAAAADPWPEADVHEASRNNADTATANPRPKRHPQCFRWVTRTGLFLPDPYSMAPR